MSPTEHCNSLTFLPDDTPLSPDAFNEWRGTPWGRTRTPVRLAVARDLHYGSTPDVDIQFTDLKGPRRPKTKCAVIGSGRPKPESPAHSRSVPSSEPHEETATVNPVKSVPSSEPHEETATVNPVDESSHTVSVSVTDTPSPNQNRSKRDVIRSRRPKLEHHGDMSNLRPDDRGMDAATCEKFYRMSTAPEDRISLTSTDSDDSDDSASTRVSFDLGAKYATRSNTEQKAKCRADARAMVEREAATTKHTVMVTKVAPDLEGDFPTTKPEEERPESAVKAIANAEGETELAAISNLSRQLTSTNLNDGRSALTEQVTTTGDDETEEAE